MEAVMLTYSIGEFSKIVGLSEHTLRFYEKEGLIKVNRDDKMLDSTRTKINYGLNLCST